MRFELKALTSAAGLTATVVFAVCALFVALAPETAIAFFGMIVHVNFASIVLPITWLGFFAGLVCAAVTAGLIALLLGWLYNGLLAPHPGSVAGDATHRNEHAVG